MSSSISSAMSICWGAGANREYSWMIVIAIMLVVCLYTMVVTCFLVVCSCYEKVLLVCWCSSLVARTHGFKLNEAEIPHNVAVVTTI